MELLRATCRYFLLILTFSPKCLLEFQGRFPLLQSYIVLLSTVLIMRYLWAGWLSLWPNYIFFALHICDILLVLSHRTMFYYQWLILNICYYWNKLGLHLFSSTEVFSLFTPVTPGIPGEWVRARGLLPWVLTKWAALGGAGSRFRWTQVLLSWASFFLKSFSFTFQEAILAPRVLNMLNAHISSFGKNLALNCLFTTIPTARWVTR